MARVEVILDVSSVERTVEWYSRVLGWKGTFDVYDKEGNCLFGEVYTSTPGTEEHPSNVGFSLARSENVDHAMYGDGWQALIYVDDLDNLYHRVLDNNGRIIADPEDQPWGAITFKMVDLNGVNLIFAQIMESPSMEEIQKRLNTK